MSLRNRPRRRERTHPTDVQACVEGRAIETLRQYAQRRPGNRVTSSIPWAPSKPTGDRGWLRLTETRKSRAIFVRGASNHVPKLRASYVRAFGF